MDLTSLYYFSEVAKDLNITKTAARLFISQQTLSNHIQRLERHFNAELLHRRPIMQLTCAGEFVLSFAQVVSKEHTNLKDILSDIEQQERGTIRVGASIARGSALLPKILPQFSKRYPNVEIRFVDAISEKLRPLVAKREIDFAVVLDEDADPNLCDQHLIDDQIYLCVSERLLREYYPDTAQILKETSIHGAKIKDFSRLPFALLSNYLGKRIQYAFDDAGFVPKTYISSTILQVAAPLCSQGLCAGFLTQMSLIDQMGQIADDVNIFPLFYQDKPMVQSLSLIRTKDRYLSHFARYFIEVLGDYFQNLAPIELARCVQG